jgi:hypothetical protein
MSIMRQKIAEHMFNKRSVHVTTVRKVDMTHRQNATA